MSVFTFTINCPVTPTPTPTPTPIPCDCREFFIENIGGTTVRATYTDCRSISRQTPNIAPGNAIYLCACDVSPDANLSISDIGPCTPTETPTPTPTNTPTPTPTVTFPPTATPIPTYTVTVYASFTGESSNIVNTAGPGGAVVESAARAYYWLGPPTAATNTLLGGNISSKSCNYLGAVSGVAQGSTFYIGMLSYSYNVPILFTAGTTNCTTGQTFCGTFLDQGGGYSFVVNSNITIYLNALIQARDFKTVLNSYSLYYCNYNNSID
jgi:hypothetical protein